jgi:hypothetical protein
MSSENLQQNTMVRNIVFGIKTVSRRLYYHGVQGSQVDYWSLSLYEGNIDIRILELGGTFYGD